MDAIIEDLYASGQLFPFEEQVETSLNLDGEYALFTGMAENGHSLYDLFLYQDGLLYWAGISLGTPAGETPLSHYEKNREVIDTYLIDVIHLMIGKATGVPVAGCQVVSAEPVAGADTPTFTIVATGFEPNDVLAISLMDASSGGMGTLLFGSATADGKLEGDLAWAGTGTTPTNLVLLIKSSTCQISQELTWP
jgi:hypothetical protein